MPVLFTLKKLYCDGERRGKGRCMERVTWKTYITISKLDSQQEFVAWLRKLKQGLCINLEEWNGTGDGREVQKGGGICISVADSC